MSDISKLKEEVIKVVRSLTIANLQNGLSVRELMREYRNIEGITLPYLKLGFSTIEDFLKDIPDVVRLQWVNGEYFLNYVSEENTNHIAKLVARQKPDVKRNRRILKARRVGSERCPKKTIRVVSANLRSRFINLLSQFSPRGISIYNFENTYKAMYGCEIGWVNLGFQNLQELLSNVPDITLRDTCNGLQVQLNPSIAPKCALQLHQSEHLNPSIATKDGTSKSECKQSVRALSSIMSSEENVKPPKIEGAKKSSALASHNAELVNSKVMPSANAEYLPMYASDPTQSTNQMHESQDGSVQTKQNDLWTKNEVFDTLNAKVCENFRKILAAHPKGLDITLFPEEYQKLTGNILNVNELGFQCVLSMVSELPEIFGLEENPMSTTRWVLHDARKWEGDTIISDIPPSSTSRWSYAKEVSRKIQANILSILRSFPGGVKLKDFGHIYEMNFHEPLEILALGFENIHSFFEHLSEYLPIFFQCVGGTSSVLLLSEAKMKEWLEDHHPRTNEICAPMKSGQTFITARDLPVDAIALGADYVCQQIPEGTDLHQYVPVYVSNVDNPGCIWIQIRGVKTTLALEDLMNDLELYCRFEGSFYKIPECLYLIGLCCAAIYPEDKSWHRVKIMGIPSQDVVDVLFVDYGTRCVVSPSDMRLLKRRHMALPAQAIPATLAQIKPANKTWTREAKIRLLELTKLKPLMALFEQPMDESLKCVYLCDVSKENVDIHINDVLVQEKHAKWLDEVDEEPQTDSQRAGAMVNTWLNNLMNELDVPKELQNVESTKTPTSSASTTQPIASVAPFNLTAASPSKVSSTASSHPTQAAATRVSAQQLVTTTALPRRELVQQPLLRTIAPSVAAYAEQAFLNTSVSSSVGTFTQQPLLSSIPSLGAYAQQSLVNPVTSSLVEYVQHSLLGSAASSVREQVDHPILESAASSVREQVEHPILESAASSVREQVGHPILESATSSIREQVGHPILGSAASSVREQVGHSILGSAGSSVREQVGHPILGSAASSVREQVGHPILGSAASSVREQVGHPILGSAASSVREQVGHPILGSAGSSLREQVGHPVLGSAASSVREQVGHSILGSAGSSVGEQVGQPLLGSAVPSVGECIQRSLPRTAIPTTQRPLASTVREPEISTLVERENTYLSSDEAEDQEDSAVYQRHVKRTQLTNYVIHVIDYNDVPYVTSWDLSSLFWKGDVIAKMLQLKQYSVRSIQILRSNEKELFAEMDKFKMVPANSLDLVTLYPLNCVPKLLDVFSHMSPTIREEISYELNCFKAWTTKQSEKLMRDKISKEKKMQAAQTSTPQKEPHSSMQKDLQILVRTLEIKRKELIESLAKDFKEEIVERIHCLEMHIEGLKKKLNGPSKSSQNKNSSTKCSDPVVATDNTEDKMLKEIVMALQHFGLIGKDSQDDSDKKSNSTKTDKSTASAPTAEQGATAMSSYVNYPQNLHPVYTDSSAFAHHLPLQFPLASPIITGLPFGFAPYQGIQQVPPNVRFPINQFGFIPPRFASPNFFGQRPNSVRRPQ